MHKKRNIALVDPFWDGHHKTYLKQYTKVLLQLGHNVSVFAPYPTEIESFIKDSSNEILQNYSGYKFSLPKTKKGVFFTRTLLKTISAVNFWIKTSKVITNCAIKQGRHYDLVFILWLDNYLMPIFSVSQLDKIFPYSWVGLYFHPYYLRGKVSIFSYLKHLANMNPVLKTKNCKAIAILDEGLKSKFDQILSDKTCVIFPDITDDREANLNFKMAKEISKLAGKKIVISLLGYLEKRKGVLQFLEASKHCCDDQYFFVLVGAFPEEDYSTKELESINEMKKYSNKYFMSFNPIPDGEEFNSLFGITDILYAAYIDFPHSSNILTKAAIFRKLLITDNKYCIAERIKKYKMGKAIDASDSEACANAIKDIGNRNVLDKMKQEALFNDYARNHNIHALKQSFLDLFNQIT